MKRAITLITLLLVIRCDQLFLYSLASLVCNGRPMDLFPALLFVYAIIFWFSRSLLLRCLCSILFTLSFYFGVVLPTNPFFFVIVNLANYLSRRRDSQNCHIYVTLGPSTCFRSAQRYKGLLCMKQERRVSLRVSFGSSMRHLELRIWQSKFGL